MKMRHSSLAARTGFSLMETVIAISILAILLTAFMAVFGPATTGIRRSISAQEADRLVSAARQELEVLRPGEEETYPTSFDKAQEWIKNSHEAATAIVVYEYRGELQGNPRTDGTPAPYAAMGGIPGSDFSVQPIARQMNNPFLEDDLAALEGRIYVVKMRQLIPSTGEDPELTPSSTPSVIENPDELAVLPFVAEFYALPSTDVNYLNGTGFSILFGRMDGTDVRPIFSRNLAVRR